MLLNLLKNSGTVTLLTKPRSKLQGERTRGFVEILIKEKKYVCKENEKNS
jgi:hypothetical protein